MSQAKSPSLQMFSAALEQFKELTLKDAEQALDFELTKLTNTIPEQHSELKADFKHQMLSFRRLFQRYLRSTSDELDWSKIKPVPAQYLKTYGELLKPPGESVTDLLNKLVVVKLNGGLGTSMGCKGPKSLIVVRDDLTFLDLTVQQIETLNRTHNTSIPLILMDSFNTNKDTEKVLRKYKQLNVHIETFMQSTCPRLNRESNLPEAHVAYVDDIHEEMAKSLPKDSIDADQWYPPGHGDFYRSFVRSGLAKKMLDAGKEWVFVSNIDNLGATVDLKILNFLMSKIPTGGGESREPEFVMEVTDKTRADVKGGTLTTYDGRLRLLELAQVPSDHVDEFASVRKFRIFNTNNLWVNLKSMYELVEQQKLEMEMIVNPKTTSHGVKVIQLEEAAGAAIKSFNQAYGINVPRSRFLPVKKTSDLLIIMSNLYELNAGRLILSPSRQFQSVPLVKLGSHFNKVADFLARFRNVPDLLELDHLTVTGDVYFGKNIILKGTVIIIANFGSLITMPSGSCIENKIVSGNLRILDH